MSGLTPENQLGDTIAADNDPDALDDRAYAFTDEPLASHVVRVHALEADLVELNETAHAFKLLNEKQVAEINAKELLLMRKNERIDELLQQLKARDAQLEVKNNELQERDARIKQLQMEIVDLHDQLKKEEEDFSMVTAALEAKEQALVKKTQELLAASEIEKLVRKDLDRSQVIIRRLEKNVEDLCPEQADACLSPRSFHENQLIQLRDDAISAKTREVWLLTGQNDQLRVQLDDLEAAMEQLQTNFISKENDVARKQRKIDKLEMEIEALQVSRSQAEGREKAMEIATTQNQKLLLALEAQERTNEELLERAERIERECEQLRKTHYSFLEKSAVSEVEVIHKTKEAEEKTSIVNNLQTKLQRERKVLQQELSTARLNYQMEIEKMQSELVMRRNKQYELTLKLQDVEARLHAADDGFEDTSEQLLATRCRMEELERVLQDALQWKIHLEQQLSFHTMEATQNSNAQQKQTQEAQSEIVTLKAQLKELKDELVKKLSQEKHLARQIHEFKQLVDVKEALVREQRDRINRLVQEVNRESQARAEVELEKQLLCDQLEKLREQMEGAIKDVEAQKRRLDEKHRLLQEKFETLESECTKEQVGKSKLVMKFADTFAAAAVPANRNAWTSLGNLDLRECWLADHDLLPLLRMLEHAPDALTRVDLRSNRITQDGMRVLAVFVKKLAGWLSGTAAGGGGCGGHCRVRDIDLRHNFISLDGVRTVASGIESLVVSNTAAGGNNNSNHSASGIKSVVVKSGGRIECFADAKAEQTGGVPMLIVDITANFDAETLVTEARKINRRRGREWDTGGGGAASFGNNNSHSTAAANKDTSRDLQLQGVYGVDLVSTLLGSDNGVMSANNSRRKSALLEKNRLMASSSSVSSSTTQLPPVLPFASEGNSARLSSSSSLPKLNG